MTNQICTEYSVLPTGCDIDSRDRSYFVVRVVYRGKGLWAVVRQGETLGHGGSWEYESQPSSREDDYFAEHRWDLDAALTAAHSVVDALTVNGKTFAEWETHHAAVLAAKNAAESANDRELT